MFTTNQKAFNLFTLCFELNHAELLNVLFSLKKTRNYCFEHENLLIYHLDDLEIVDLKHLQAAQDEMIKKLSIMEDEGGVGGEISESSSASATPKVHKKFDGVRDGNLSASKRHRWKNWGWKHSPAKSSSIEEETSAALLESPKKSLSSKSSTPNQSPKHKFKVNQNDAVLNGDELSTPFRRRKQKSEVSKSELRSSAGARLIQLLENTEGINKVDSECDEFYALLPENGRPASIHIIQTLKNSQDEF